MKIILSIWAVLLFGGLTYCQGSDSILDIPIQVNDFIQARVMQDILDYRLWINPEFSVNDRIKSKKPGEKIEFNYYNDKIFDPPLLQGERLLFEISRWPSDKPRTNFYLVTKSGNRFLRYSDRGKSAWRSRVDTVIREDYSRYDKYYSNDDVFLIYYDGKEVYKKISGNFIQDWYTPDWFSYNKLPGLAAWFRVVQYGAEHPYRIMDTPTDWLLFFDKCNLIKNDPGRFIVKMSKKYYYTSFEIIFYSNKKEITGDSNNANFYEIVYKRDYSKHWWPDFYNDTQPTISKITPERITELNKYYNEVIYKFGDIDYSIFNKD